jgi:hypothetical protein
MANIRAESPLKAGCICGLKREWHDLRKPWTFAFELFWRTVRTAQVEYYATDRVFVWGIFLRGEASCRRIPCCYRYVVLTNSRHRRPFEQVSPLGKGTSFRTGPLGRCFEARREPTACWEGVPVGHGRLWVKWHVSILEVAEVTRALSAN